MYKSYSNEMGYSVFSRVRGVVIGLHPVDGFNLDCPFLFYI